MKPKDRYLSRMAPAVASAPVPAAGVGGGGQRLLHQQPQHQHQQHPQQQQHQHQHRRHASPTHRPPPAPAPLPPPQHVVASLQQPAEQGWCEPMDLRVKKAGGQAEEPLPSLVYGQLAARYLLLDAEMREKQLSSLLPLLLLRPFAAAAAAAAASAVASPAPPASSGSETELRLADTTHELLDERKRVTRPLTGRYVRHGTGASPATLLTLRRVIQERQRQRRSPHVSPHKKSVKRKIRKRK